MTDQLTLTSAADLPAITLDDVRAAAGRINGSVVRTPTLHSQTPIMASGSAFPSPS
jgi:threonine dehydratase